MRGFHRLKIRNRGNQSATSVAVSWQGGGYACVKKSDGTLHSEFFKDSLDLGKLPIGEELEIELWTLSEYVLFTPYVRHDHGKTALANQSLRWTILTAIFPTLLWMLPVIFLVLILDEFVKKKLREASGDRERLSPNAMGVKPSGHLQS